jgi:sterol 24-C-methyltransferase
MSKTGALDLASGLGGKINKEGVKSAVDEYVYTLPLRDPAA